jgi:hypothetical protein
MHPPGARDNAFAAVNCGFVDVGTLSDEKVVLKLTVAVCLS